MKEKELRELIEKNTQDGAINYGEVYKSVNSEINNLIAKKQPDTEKIKGEAVNEFLGKYSFKGVDEFNQKLGEYKDYAEKVKDYETVKSEAEQYKRYTAIYSKGYSNPEQVEFIDYHLSKKTGEDKKFEDLLEEYAKQTPPDKIIKFSMGANKGGQVKKQEGLAEYFSKYKK